MVSRSRRLLVWFPVTTFAAVLFTISMVPPAGALSRLVFGSALFVSLCTLVGLPRRLRNATRAPRFLTCIAAGCEAALILLGVLLYALWLFPSEMALDLERCEVIVREVETGRLREQIPGLVRLPEQLNGVDFDGNVYVTSVPGGRLFLFKTMQLRVRPADFRGYVYSTSPIDNAVLQRRPDGSVSFDVNCVVSVTGEVVALSVVPKATTSRSWFRVSSFELRNSAE